MKTVFTDAGIVLPIGPVRAIHPSFEVTLAQFSDMLPSFEVGRFKEFDLTVEERIGDRWPIHSWGMGTIGCILEAFDERAIQRLDCEQQSTLTEIREYIP